MTCQEALKKLYEIIDNEASRTDVERVKEHLHACKSCMSRYEFEKLFKTFVIDKATAPTKTDLLKASIMSRCAEIDKGSTGDNSRRMRFWPVLTAAAAALIICIVAAFSTAGFYRHMKFVYPIEKIHFQSFADTNKSNQSFATLTSARDYITNDMHLALGDIQDGYDMVGAQFDKFQDQDFIQIKYIYSGTPVSLFIGPDNDIRLPDFTQREWSNIEYFHHICRGCQVMYWRMNDRIVIAVSENKELDLTPLIPAISAL